MSKFLPRLSLAILLLVIGAGLVSWAMPTHVNPFPGQALSWEQVQLDLANKQIAAVRFMEADSSHVLIQMGSGDIVMGELPYCKAGIFSECNTADIEYSGAVAALQKAVPIDKASSGPLTVAETSWLAYHDTRTMDTIKSMPPATLLVLLFGVMLILFAAWRLVGTTFNMMAYSMRREVTSSV
jgi:hypothetical protein